MSPYEAFSYRDNETGLRMLRDEIALRRGREMHFLPKALVSTYARRASRIAGGVTALLGAGAVALCALLGPGVKTAFGASLADVRLTSLLLGTVAVVPVVTLLARIVAGARIKDDVARAFETTSDPRSDLDRFERASPSQWVAARAHALERASIAWPLAGWALLAPLTLHFVFSAVVLGTFSSMLHDFDEWILISLVLTVPAHAVLAWLGFRFARKIALARTSGEADAVSVWSPLGWTMLAGCLPGIILYLVPPILVTITGLLFIPATFSYIKYRALNERVALDEHLPIAPEAENLAVILPPVSGPIS